MGKIIVSISITLDGFVDAQHVVINPEFYEFTQELLAKTTHAAFGRHTFEMFQERWPKRLQDPATPDWIMRMAKVLDDIPKVVFSSTLKTTTWNNSSLVSLLDIEYVNAFRKNDNGILMTIGSPGLIETLTEMNAVDEYYFTIQPTLAGKGDVRFFKTTNLPSSLGLKYINCRQLASGAHIVHYENTGARKQL